VHERPPAPAGSKAGAPALAVLEIEVPESLVHSRAWFNELVLDQLPEGTRLKRLDFVPTKSWWLR
jgi:hypothetical protein